MLGANHNTSLNALPFGPGGFSLYKRRKRASFKLAGIVVRVANIGYGGEKGPLLVICMTSGFEKPDEWFCRFYILFRFTFPTTLVFSRPTSLAPDLLQIRVSDIVLKRGKFFLFTNNTSNSIFK